MIRRIIIPSLFAILAYGFWISPSFKEVAAGVAIFLFGMLALEEGFRSFTGGTLERLLERGTDRVWKSLGLGALTTGIMQSSSLVSLITISFLGAGLIALKGAAGIIFGANVGTTTTAWIVAGFGVKVKLAAYALPMLVFGIILVLTKRKPWSGAGYVLGGLGFLLLGIGYMKSGFDAVQSSIDLTAFAVPGLSGLLLFVLVGMVTTVITQSSSAAIVLVITALAAGQISYENALAAAIGSNVGTTITAIIGAMGSNVDGRRLAVIHLAFNLFTALVAILIFRQLVLFVDMLSVELSISPRDFALKLAVFHSVFNVGGVMLMTPFLGLLVRAVERIVPDRGPRFAEPHYLNSSALEFPDSAIEAVRMETIRLFDEAIEIIAHGLGLRKHDILSEKDIGTLVRAPREDAVESIEEKYSYNIKSIYSAIIAYISRAPETMTAEQSERLYSLRRAGRNVSEAVKGVKHVRKNMFSSAFNRNAFIKDEYDSMRAAMAGVLRELAEVRDGEDELEILALNALRVRLKQEYVDSNKRIDNLVRNDRIDARAASSMVNDLGYTFGVCERLIEMGEILFASKNRAVRQVEKLLSVDESNIQGEKLAPTSEPQV